MKKYSHFTKQDRNEISILLKKGYSIRDIASVLKKNPSSVSREINRNKVKGIYDSLKAQHKARVKRKRAKFQWMKIREHSWIEDYVQDKLKSKWSPEQIAGRLKQENNGKTVISFRSIYQYLDSQFGKEYRQYLKYKRPWRKKKRKTQTKREHIKNRVFIEHRPEIINNRLRIGDFEGDTMGKPRTSAETLAVLTDRKSRLILAKKITRLKHAIEGFNELLEPVRNSVQSLTLDNGLENIRYQELKTDTYFCQPYSAWQKGGVENAIGLIREYIPKKARPEDYSAETISAIVNEINNTPRKCLNYQTPSEVFFKEHLTKTLSLDMSKCCT